ncbi:hypothetical protein S40288_03439 [Stachybotrys chartarum IBT 40288]|nr:hypothetical protein S40288_03439 [Stachybotrys chartarum IBT 40288]
MVNKVHAVACAADFLFLVTGCIQLGFSLIVRSQMFDRPTEGQQAVRNLLYQRFPLDAGIANGALILVAFALTLPALIMPARGWLKVAGGAVTACGLFTLIIGVILWVMTLRIRADFAGIYVAQEPSVQELMQTSFECCGYQNSTSPAFITDPTCPSPAAAALVRGCGGPISSFGNIILDNIFTAVFGMVGIDALFILVLACLRKDRKERERYRHIDEKTDYLQI